MWWAVATIIAVGLGFVAFTGAPYIPSKRRDLGQAFRDLRPVTDDDVLVDLGSGDGIVLREARRAGVGRAVGYEIHPLLVVVSKILSRGDRSIDIRLKSYWSVDFPDDTTLVYTFGDGRDIRKMYDKVVREASRLGREIDFVSYAFEVPRVTPSAVHRTHFLYRVEPLQKR